jgi:hypothetical protein
VSNIAALWCALTGGAAATSTATSAAGAFSG